MSLGKEEKTHENPLPELFLKRKKVDHAAVDRQLAEKKRVREEIFQQTKDPNADDFTEGVNWYWKDQPKFNYCWYFFGTKEDPLYGHIPTEAMKYLSHEVRSMFEPKKPEEKPEEKKPEGKKPVQRKRKVISSDKSKTAKRKATSPFMSKKKNNIKTTPSTQQPNEKPPNLIHLGDISKTEIGFRMADILTDGAEGRETRELTKRKQPLQEKKK